MPAGGAQQYAVLLSASGIISILLVRKEGFVMSEGSPPWEQPAVKRADGGGVTSQAFYWQTAGNRGTQNYGV